MFLIVTNHYLVRIYLAGVQFKASPKPLMIKTNKPLRDITTNDKTK